MRRILTIDGGGIKGVFPASFLATIEDAIHDRTANYFDLIVGTSTGGIIALGLGLGLRANEILDFYVSRGPQIFRGGFAAKIKHLIVAKYRSDGLRRELEAVLHDRKLGESQTRLVIPSMDVGTGDVHIYKTAHHPRFERDFRMTAVEVALATSAAPAYFPTHWSSAGSALVDGGMWANNPTGLAVVEAIGVLNWPREEIQVLSLGCPNEPLNVGLGRHRPMGLLYWAPTAIKVMMAAQSSASLGTAAILASHQQVTRIQPTAPEGRFDLDSTKELNALRGLGDSQARYYLPALRVKFFTQHTDPFVPEYSLP